jgi:predicted dehydrogenase
MTKKGIGFIGSGFARSIQAPCFRLCDQVKLIGCASPNNAEDFAKDFEMPFHSNDWRELIDHPDVDLVCITTPPLYHFEQARYALMAGKHVLCEKPFTLTVGQSKELVKLAAEKKVLALIDHELRFNPWIKWVQEQIQEGFLGNIYFANAFSHISYKRDASLPFDWWSEKESGGGAWGAIASHLTDQMHFHVGPIAQVKTLMNTSIKNRKDKNGKVKEVTSDDTAHALLQFENGATGTIFTSLVSNENSFLFEVTGSEGSLKFDMRTEVFRAKKNGAFEHVSVPLSSEQQRIQQKIDTAGMKSNSIFARSFIHYAHAIANALSEEATELKGAATFADGLRIQQVLDKGWNNTP